MASTDSNTWNLPAPAGATRVYRPGPNMAGQPVRCFLGTSRQVYDVTIDIDGEQHPDGRVERQIGVWIGDGPSAALAAEQARELAAALLAAADELDALAGVR